MVAKIELFFATGDIRRFPTIRKLAICYIRKDGGHNMHIQPVEGEK
jgi:hypothetical protein